MKKNPLFLGMKGNIVLSKWKRFPTFNLEQEDTYIHRGIGNKCIHKISIVTVDQQGNAAIFKGLHKKLAGILISLIETSSSIKPGFACST